MMMQQIHLYPQQFTLSRFYCYVRLRPDKGEKYFACSISTAGRCRLAGYGCGGGGLLKRRLNIDGSDGDRGDGGNQIASGVASPQRRHGHGRDVKCMVDFISVCVVC